MQVQFQYITDLAKQYKSYADDSDSLFNAVNLFSKEYLNDIFKEFGDPERDFQPVNLLRAEVARRLLNGEAIDEKTVEVIKDKIRLKDVGFFQSYNAEFLGQMVQYANPKRDLFANWQRPWTVFHSYFYRGVVKENVRNYLEQICQDLISSLHLEDFTYHWVDFQGASNFGSEWCWIALYPDHKASHKLAYQFFLKLSSVPEAGRVAGFSIESSKPNILYPVKTYDDVLKVFNNLIPDIVSLNGETRNFFKFSPSSQAQKWNEFYTAGIAAIGFNTSDFGNLNQYISKNQIKAHLGLKPEEKSWNAWNTWLFKTAKIGDVLFANKGTNTCIGIGIITGEYYFKENVDDFQHRRSVTWITNKVYEYKSNSLKGFKNLFRPDTFSPTRAGEFILTEYVRLYPELAEVFTKYDLPFKEVAEAGAVVEESENLYDTQEELEPDIEIEGNQNFWWLNANPEIWKIGNHGVEERQRYTTHNEKGNKRRIYKYFEQTRPGDIIIGYESSPTKQIKALYEVTKGIHQGENGEEIEFRVTSKLEIPVHWNELKNNPGLQSCEVFNNNQGSLFKLSPEEFDIIQEIIDNKNIFTERLQEQGIRKYSLKEDDEKPFISNENFVQATTILLRKKNIILQGPPGVGKTFIARKLAYEIMGEENDSNIEMVQFHQSYSYEDFIQGVRPVKGGFDVRDGVFYSFCQRALAHPERKFFFIIDEINRGNLSKIFGELMMLIEPDKRKKKFEIVLTYSVDGRDKFYVPENLYLIGTMNTADRSLAIVDYALRRRFAFINLQPDYGEPFQAFLKEKGISPMLVNHITSSVAGVNAQIKDDPNLGDGFQIGHSYFCTYTSTEDENKWWNDILKFELTPLLEEIWFDDKGKVLESIRKLSH